MTNLRARIITDFQATAYQNDARLTVDKGQTAEFEFGETGANRANKAFEETRAITASATLSYIFDATPDDFTGTGIDLASIKAIRVQNTGTTGLTLGGTCNGVAAITIPAGGVYQVVSSGASGFTNTAGTASGSITITNTSGSTAGAFSIAVLGIAL